jgi:hypothetical protein
MKKSKSILLWVVAFVLMLVLAVYQRMTGPTYPVSGSITFNNDVIKYKFPRSNDGPGDDIIKIRVQNKNVLAYIKYKRFKSNDDWTVKQLRRDDDYLVASIPEQPPAGKVMYQISLVDFTGNNKTLTDEPVIIRFKGVVPPYILYPHILFMFVGMVYSLRAGLEAFYKGNKTYAYSLFTMNLIIIGGLILGPIVQYLAFGAFWTGWPFGHDLTDNKTLLVFIAWIVTVFQLKKHPERKYWAIIATIVTIAVYLVPHSVLGSEIDYTKLPK